MSARSASRLAELRTWYERGEKAGRAALQAELRELLGVSSASDVTEQVDALRDELKPSRVVADFFDSEGSEFQ